MRGIHHVMVFAGLMLLTAATPSKEQLNQLGTVYAMDGNLEDALRTFTRVLAMAENDPAALNNAANVYLLQGNADTALRLYTTAFEASSQKGGVALNLAVAHYLHGDRDQSTRFVRIGLDLFDDHDEAYRILGTVASVSDSAASVTESGSDKSSTDALLRDALAKIPAESAEGDPYSTVSRARAVLETEAGATRGATPHWPVNRLYWARGSEFDRP